MDSRLTANSGPSMVSPAFRFSNVVVIATSRFFSDAFSSRELVSTSLENAVVSCWPDGPAAARTNHLAAPVEEHVVVHHEQPLALDELVERARRKRDDVAGPRRNVVAPGLPGIDGARRAHPVVRRRAGKHQENVDRGRRDQPAIAGGLGVSFVEIDRMILADGLAVELDGFAG